MEKFEMNLRIELINEQYYDLWDSFIASSLNGTIFHKSFWLKSLGNHFDIWGVYDNGNLQAGFVAPYKQFLRQYVISPQFLTPYSGLVLKGYEGKYVNKLSFEKNITTKLARFLKSKYRWGVLIFAPRTEYILPFMWEGLKVIPWYTYILDISDIKKVWQEMGKKQKANIRKAIADGLTVIVGRSFNSVIKLVEKTYQRQNLVFKSKLAYRYFSELQRRNLCETFICIDADGNELAGSFILWDEKKAYSFLSGYNAKMKHRGAVSLCRYEAIKFASEQLDLKEIDFEAGMIPNIEEFNRRWGGKLTPHYEIRWGRGIDLMIKLKRFFTSHFKL